MLGDWWNIFCQPPLRLVQSDQYGCEWLTKIEHGLDSTWKKKKNMQIEIVWFTWCKDLWHFSFLWSCSIPALNCFKVLCCHRYSLFYVTGEFYMFLHWGWAKSCSYRKFQYSPPPPSLKDQKFWRNVTMKFNCQPVDFSSQPMESSHWDLWLTGWATQPRYKESLSVSTDSWLYTRLNIFVIPHLDAQIKYRTSSSHEPHWIRF